MGIVFNVERVVLFLKHQIQFQNFIWNTQVKGDTARGRRWRRREGGDRQSPGLSGEMVLFLKNLTPKEGGLLEEKR